MEKFQNLISVVAHSFVVRAQDHFRGNAGGGAVQSDAPHRSRPVTDTLCF